MSDHISTVQRVIGVEEPPRIRGGGLRRVVLVLGHRGHRRTRTGVADGASIAAPLPSGIHAGTAQRSQFVATAAGTDCAARGVR
jgi:hypothetical protein